MFLNARQVRSDSGASPLILLSIEDMTERAESSAMLQYEQERLAVALRSIGDGVIIADSEGKVVVLNSVAQVLTGWSQEEARGIPAVDVFHVVSQQARERCQDPIRKVLATGSIVGLANHTVLIARDGTERAIDDSGAPIRDKEGQTIGVVLVFRDVTERLAMEKRLRQAEKMEAIGTLAGGIAHDFNNILGIILGNVELTLDDVPDWNPAKGNLKEIRSATIRARDIVKQILSLSRHTLVGRKPIRVTPIIEETLNLMRASIPTSIRIRRDLRAESDIILSDQAQVSQILMNISTNAYQEMRDGGNWV